jgi:hypothetical protein
MFFKCFEFITTELMTNFRDFEHKQCPSQMNPHNQPSVITEERALIVGSSDALDTD